MSGQLCGWSVGDGPPCSWDDSPHNPAGRPAPVSMPFNLIYLYIKYFHQQKLGLVPQHGGGAERGLVPLSGGGAGGGRGAEGGLLRGTLSPEVGRCSSTAM